MEKKNQIIKRCLTTPTELRIREAEGDEPSRTISGYAILFNNESAPLWEDEKSEAREVIAPEAVTRELLDEQDIKMTMFHDRQLILARSNHGEGTLAYNVDDKGVSFTFDAPKTADGDKALELVRRGDISGCSFMFTTRYYDEECVSRETTEEDGKTKVTYIVRSISGIYDFTLAADPAYPDTSVEARELAAGLKIEETDNTPSKETQEQWRTMRQASGRKITEPNF